MMIIDADSHVIESEETWQYLDPAYRHRRPFWNWVFARGGRLMAFDRMDPDLQALEKKKT